MIYGVYVIRDIKSNFLIPTPEINDQFAIRNFAHAVQTSDGVIHSHKEDFELYKVAEYDNETGFLKPFDVRVLIAEGKDF